MPRLNRSPEDLELAEAHGRDYLEILARGLRVLAAFGTERARLTISEVAQLVGLNRATARRILFTLERLGYLESDGRAFRLTPRVLAFAQSYLASSVVPAVMQPIVERISAAAGENCSAAVLHDLDVVFVARATPVRSAQSIVSRRSTSSSSFVCPSFGIGRLAILLQSIQYCMARAFAQVVKWKTR